MTGTTVMTEAERAAVVKDIMVDVKVHMSDHALVHHKIAILRDAKTNNKEFRELAEEIAMLLTCDATRNLPLETVEVTTGMGVRMQAQKLSNEEIMLAAILRASLGMVDGMLKLMPTAIIGGVSFLLYAMISGIGIRNMVENKVDLKKGRNQIILAMILACGLGLQSGITFSIGGTAITLTPLAVASIVGIVLNAALPGKDYDFGTHLEGDQNQGIHV